VAVPSSDLTAELQSFSITAHYSGSTTFAASSSSTVKTVPYYLREGTGVSSDVVAITDDNGNFRNVPFNTGMA